jgi:response regulator RpfG family c-di-GMP phosphodiesterase
MRLCIVLVYFHRNYIAMKHSGPIITIDDDSDDLDFMKDLLSQIVNNEIIQFQSCELALEYLQKNATDPFLIFCDVSVHGMNGIEFKSRLDQDHTLRGKSIPFIFLSTAISNSVMRHIYRDLHIQGYFTKPNSLTGMRDLMTSIIEYWSKAELPSEG